jgi:uncharacterized DUF497 family protein
MLTANRAGLSRFTRQLPKAAGLTVCTSVHTLGRGRWRMGPRKATANLKKHGVDFADAATVLHDEQAITVRDDEGDEERYLTIGVDALGNVLVVVYTWRGERRRLISARKATPQEREQYGVKP